MIETLIITLKEVEDIFGVDYYWRSWSVDDREVFSKWFWQLVWRGPWSSYGVKTFPEGDSGFAIVGYCEDISMASREFIEELWDACQQEFIY